MIKTKIIALALVLGGVYDKFNIPFWVIIVAACTMGLGTSFGGWRIIRTMGLKMLKLHPYQGFSAESAAGLTILGASQFGIPLSTTHTIGTSIMGSGIAHRKSALKLGVIKRIILAWVLTFPICGAMAFLLTLLLRLIF